jgi:plastocyanin
MMTASRIRPLISVVAAAALISTLAIAASARPAARVVPTRDTKIVKGMATTWAPSTIRISRNDKIKWKAVAGVHTVTSYRANWNFNDSLIVGSPVIRKFTQAGTFKFRCTLHSSLVGSQCSGMCGKAVVSA